MERRVILPSPGAFSHIFMHFNVECAIPANAFFILLVLSMCCISGVMTGITMIIPNVLGQALERYKDTAGTAASLFGLYYYILIAAFTALMAFLHNGTKQQLPLFFVLISICLVGAYYLGSFGKQLPRKD